MKKLLLGILMIGSFCLAGCGSQNRTIISTPDAPKAIGPYSQAVVIDDMVYCAGQIALDPVTGQIVGDTVKDQTTQIFKNIGAVLTAANSDFEHVVKTTVYLFNINDFDEMNSVYATYFKEGNYPARTAIGDVRLPKNAYVEIEVIATVK